MSNEMYNFICGWLTTIIPPALGVFGALPVLIWGYLKADVPAYQVRKTFMSFGESKRKGGWAEAYLNKLMDREADSRSKKEEVEAGLVNTWLLRLNKEIDYEDLKRICNAQATQLYVAAAALGVFAIVSQTFSILIISIILIAVGMNLMTLKKMSLISEIKKLNKAILFEMPVMIATFAEALLTGKKSVDAIFADYYPRARASKQDIKLALADFKSQSRQIALTKMAERMQAGVQFSEATQFLDMLKEDSNLELTCFELRKTSSRIFDLHVFPYVLNQRASKERTLTTCAFVALVIVFFLYVAPDIISALTDMNMQM